MRERLSKYRLFKCSLFIRIVFLLFFIINLVFFFGASALATTDTSTNYSWSGENIIFNNKTFIKKTTKDAQTDTAQTIYFFSEGQTAAIIKLNPDNPANATYTNYSYDSFTNKLSNPTNEILIKADTNAAPTTPNSDQVNRSNDSEQAVANESQEAEAKTTESCTIKGLGWIVCPVVENLAEGMDTMYGVVSKFMEVQPIENDSSTVLSQAWLAMRNLANIMFIIALLVTVISHITSVGISSYALKKIFPRLIVGAILVNMSFYICALAVDLSNILGVSLANVFINIQQKIAPAAVNQISWLSYAKAALGGGALALIGGVAAFTFAGGAVGIILTLLMALVGAIITIIAAILTLAARQALVITLIVVSPVALVANLMPNTEAYTKKWLTLFKQMLILFPMFSVVYGGAQLAGTIIIANATDVVVLLLGMLVQIVPLILLPKMIKDSNAILSNFSNALDNSIFNPLRTKAGGYLQSQKDLQKARYLSESNFNPKSKFNVPRKIAQSIEQSKRRVALETEAFKKLQDANFETKKANSDEKRPFAYSNNAFYRAKILEREAEMANETAKNQVKASVNAVIDNVYKKNLKNGNLKNLEKQTSPEAQLALSSIRLRIANSQEKMNKVATDVHYDDMLFKRFTLDGKDLVKESTGVFQGKESSEISMLSKIINANRKEHEDSVKANIVAFDHYNLTNDDKEKLAFGADLVVGKDSEGNSFNFEKKDAGVQEAAIKFVMSTKRIDLTQKMLEQSGSYIDDSGQLQKGALHDFRAEIARGIWDNTTFKGAVYMGNVTPDLASQDKINQETLGMLMFNNVVKGRIGKDILASQDKDATEEVIKLIKNLPKFNNLFTGKNQTYNDRYQVGNGVEKLTKDMIKKAITTYKEEAQKTLSDELITSRMNIKQIEKLKEITELDIPQSF